MAEDGKHVVLMRDLTDSARDLSLAYRFTGQRAFADQAAWILRQYSDRYLGYSLHDTQGHVSKSAGRVMAQTLDEAIWLISVAWAYDLLRDAAVLSSEEKQKVELSLLRAAAETIGMQGRPSCSPGFQTPKPGEQCGRPRVS